MPRTRGILAVITASCVGTLFLSAIAVAEDLERPSLTLQSSQYFSSSQTYFSDSAQTHNESLILDLDRDGRWHRFTGRVNLHDEMSSSENWNYFDLKELYASARWGEENSFSLGRKLDTWSEWEAPWGQGLFQPRYVENRLRPLTAGLIGAFVTAKAGDVTFTAGALPAAIPEMGAHFEVKNDRLVSANPWFHDPTSQFLFRGDTGEIHYSVNRPNDMDVISHFGGIAKIELRRDHYLLRASYAYKPMPQLLLGFPENQSVQLQSQGQTGGETMNVQINARVVYHQMFNLDQSFQLGPWKISASAAYEAPQPENWSDNWTHQQAIPAKIWSVSASRPLEEEGPHAARLGLHYLRIDGGDGPDQGYFAGDQTLFERRYQYQEAYMVQLSKPFRGVLQQPIDVAVKAIFDRLQNGGVFSFESGTNFSPNFRADMQMDLIGLLGDSAQIEDGFLWDYRANDRFSVGMTYVF